MDSRAVAGALVVRDLGECLRGVLALDKASLDGRAGDVHGPIGENGVANTLGLVTVALLPVDGGNLAFNPGVSRAW